VAGRKGALELDTGETMDIENIFEKHNDEYLKFERVTNKMSNRPDLHAFLLLDKLFPEKEDNDIIESASQDEIWLSISGEQIDTLTEEQIIELVRCGFSYDSEVDSLHSFV